MTDKIDLHIEASPIKIEAYVELLGQAHSVKETAYSDYSGFNVGAALLLKNSKKVLGCNVENASYGLTMCAERTAIFKAVSEGYKPGDIEAIAIAASGKNFSPCGACRQVIHEFGPDMVVVFKFDGKIVITSSRKLLPFAYVEVE
jgi:cytidine deaminase